MRKPRLVASILIVFMLFINTNYIFANNQRDVTIPQDIELLYEGNDKDASYNYYRVAVKFGAQVSQKEIQVPKSLRIYENGQLVHTKEFKDAGKVFYDANEEALLNKYDAFYYRTFIAKHKPKGKYDYKCVLTWNNGKTKEATTTVNVSEPVDTKISITGTFDMFGGSEQVRNNYTLDDNFIPKGYIHNGVKYGYFFPLNPGGWAVNQVWPAVDGIVNTDPSTLSTDMFISNVSFKSHMMYTGPRLGSDKEVKFFIKNNNIYDNSKQVEHTREVPEISKYLTELARASQDHPSYPNGIYPKKHFEVYMGMGSGPQGNLGPEDNPNDVSYIFGKTTGVVHSQFEILIRDENGNHVPGFVFDYIEVTYNPVLFSEPIRISTDAVIRPEGYLMLNTKFNVDTSISDAKIRLSIKDILESELKEYIDFTTFDGSQINLTIDGVKYNYGDGKSGTYKYDNAKKQIIIDEMVLNANSNYNIKMSIPTKRDPATSKNIKQYNQFIETSPVYLMDLEIIENHELLQNSNDQLIRYNVKYEVKPYKIPNVN